jgi:protein TonB
MADPTRFHFDPEQRTVGAAAGRRRTWLWLGVSLLLHGALLLFALAGAARGGHTELAGVIDVVVVGPQSAGDPEAGGSAEAPPTEQERAEAPEPAKRPPEPPSAAAPAMPERPSAPPAAAAPPVRAEAERPPEIARPHAPVEHDTLAPPRRPEEVAEAPPQAQTEPREAAMRRPDGPVRPLPPGAPDRPQAVESPPDEPRTEQRAATPSRPASPSTAARKLPQRPKATAEAPPKPALAAAPRRGQRNAPPGQTASIGSPTGGDRLGRSDSDDTSNGLLNVNLNPRFRSPPPPPHYPRLSIERDEEGVVLVRALVDPAGAPQRVVLWKSSGYPLLDEAALKAVQGWRFEPMVREGRTVVSWVQVPVRFRLR